MTISCPAAGDHGWANCPACGPQRTTYAQLAEVSLANGEALINNAMAAVCDNCGTVVALPPAPFTLEIIKVDEDVRRPLADQAPAPARISEAAGRHLRILLLAGLPRIGTSPARDLTHLRQKAEDLALSLGDTLLERQSANDPNAWRTQDLLDDALDLVDSLKQMQTGLPLTSTPNAGHPQAMVDKVKQVLVVRKDLNMPRGKQCAQSSHGAVNAFAREAGAHLVQTADGVELRIPLDMEAQAWFATDYRKVVLAVHSEAELLALHQQALDAGLRCHLVRDNGLTMFEGVKTYTALALGPHADARIDALTGHLKPL
jgi:peptidyl-tRNA hydrolase, PTH2 family